MGVDAVFPDLGLLEIEGVRCSVHPPLILLHYRPDATLEQGYYLLHPALILVGGYRTYAAAFAAAYVEFQAGTYLLPEYGLGIYLVPAVAERVGLFEELQQVARVHHCAVGPEIAGTVLLVSAGKEHPGIGLGCDAYPGIGLGVLQEDVVAGFVLLDQIVLEKQGVGLGVHHAVLKVRNLADQDAGLGVKPFRRHEVLGNALVQVLCLAHIDNFPVGVVVAVHAGAVGQKAYFLADIHTDTKIIKKARRSASGLSL